MKEELDRPQHIWCNKMPHEPTTDCKQCNQLYEKYPENDMTMYQKYFPDVEVL